MTRNQIKDLAMMLDSCHDVWVEIGGPVEGADPSNVIMRGGEKRLCRKLTNVESVAIVRGLESTGLTGELIDSLVGIADTYSGKLCDLSRPFNAKIKQIVLQESQNGDILASFTIDGEPEAWMMYAHGTNVLALQLKGPVTDEVIAKVRKMYPEYEVQKERKVAT
jgi:hypothetical protein